MKILTTITLMAAMIGLVAPQFNASAAGLYIGPQAGYQQARDADNGNWLVGVAIRAKILSTIGAEASINYRQEEFGNGIVTVRNWPVMVTGLIYPLPILYGAIGAGWYYSTFDYDLGNVMVINKETKQKFGWHFGAGTELPLGIAKLTGDIRYVFLNYDFEKVPGLSGLKSDFYMVTIGLLFNLGGYVDE